MWVKCKESKQSFVMVTKILIVVVVVAGTRFTWRAGKKEDENVFFFLGLFND